jgi:hypothetical protein
MKVQELINKLNEFDQEAEICIYCSMISDSELKPGDRLWNMFTPRIIDVNSVRTGKYTQEVEIGIQE